jgi:hypothetical protein
VGDGRKCDLWKEDRLYAGNYEVISKRDVFMWFIVEGAYLCLFPNELTSLFSSETPNFNRFFSELKKIVGNLDVNNTRSLSKYYSFFQDTFRNTRWKSTGLVWKEWREQECDVEDGVRNRSFPLSSLLLVSLVIVFSLAKENNPPAGFVLFKPHLLYMLGRLLKNSHALQDLFWYTRSKLSSHPNSFFGGYFSSPDPVMQEVLEAEREAIIESCRVDNRKAAENDVRQGILLCELSGMEEGAREERMKVIQHGGEVMMKRMILFDLGMEEEFLHIPLESLSIIPSTILIRPSQISFLYRCGHYVAGYIGGR